MDELARVVAVMNGKGGVGKTSLAGNVGALVAAAGMRVLIVDLDPQGNLAQELGYTGSEVDDEGARLAEAMQFGRPVAPVNIRPQLDVLPGGEWLEDAANVLGRRDEGQRKRRPEAHSALAAALRPVAGEYELVLVDCPPGEPALQNAALGAARWLLIPTRTDDSSRKGLVKVAHRYVEARARGSQVELLGVCLFGVSSTAKHVRAQAVADLADDLGGAAPVLDATIRYAEAAAVAARRRGVPVFELEAAAAAGPKWFERLRHPESRAEPVVPGSAAALAGDYSALAAEILGLLRQREAELAEVGA